MKEKKLYLYEGPVMQFGKTINDKWKGGTVAESPKKAISNLKFSYKRRKKSNLDIHAKIDLLENCLTISD